MKKILALLMALVMVMALAGCSRDCKYEDCDTEVYKDGYCKAHYALKELGDLFN